jgi:hypothetical protein
VIDYQPTDADRAPLPASYQAEPRYLGYRAADRAEPFAKFFLEDTLPVLDHVRDALLAGMAPAEYAYPVEEAAARMSRAGYHKMETGWTRVQGGYLVACLTPMPGVTAEMWDWWFGWHGSTARYKLWYPDAHQFLAVGQDRSKDRSLTDRQRYLGNVSYVDEYVGGTLQRLAIRFVAPARLGFDEPGPGRTVICARVGPSQHPLTMGWLIHQVRPTGDGAEMRSRFFLDDPRTLHVPPSSAPGRGSALLASKAASGAVDAALPAIAKKVLGPRFGHDMIFHCASEMNHLASFLPDLYAEFKDSP